MIGTPAELEVSVFTTTSPIIRPGAGEDLIEVETTCDVSPREETLPNALPHPPNCPVLRNARARVARFRITKGRLWIVIAFRVPTSPDANGGICHAPTIFNAKQLQLNPDIH